MPPVRSKKQQAFFWGVLVPSGKMTKTAARRRSKRGAAYAHMPAKRRRRRR